MLRLMLPCEDAELTEAIIDNDGDMIFPDYDIEEELIAVELGDEPSFCASIVISWNNDPLHFICHSELFPLDLTGKILSLWCKEAARKAAKALKEAKCYKETMANIKACAKFWKSAGKLTKETGYVEAIPTAAGKLPTPPVALDDDEDEYEYDEEEIKGEPPWERYIVIDYGDNSLVKKIQQSKNNLINKWNDYVRRRLGRKSYGSRSMKQLRSTMENKVVSAALENTNFALEYINQMEMVGGVTGLTKSCSEVMCNVLDLLFIKLYPGSVDIAGDLMRMPEYMDEGREYMYMLALKEIRRYQ